MEPPVVIEKFEHYISGSCILACRFSDDLRLFQFYFALPDISWYLCWCRTSRWPANTVPFLRWTFCSW